MGFPGGNNLAPDDSYKRLIVGIVIAVIGAIFCFSTLLKSRKKGDKWVGLFRPYIVFFYSCFIKPHNGDSTGTQQDALESFYKRQAGAYDATRRYLLRG